jgi:hypothetical protein
VFASSWALIGFVAELGEVIMCMVPIPILCVYEARMFIGVELFVALKTHGHVFRLAPDCALA